MRHLNTSFRYYPEEVHRIFKLGLPNKTYLCYEYPKPRVRYIIPSCTISLHNAIIDCYETVHIKGHMLFPSIRLAESSNLDCIATHISARSTPNLELGIPFHHVLGQFQYIHVIIDCYETVQVI